MPVICRVSIKFDLGAELAEELTEQLEGQPAKRLQEEAAVVRRRSNRDRQPRRLQGAPPRATVPHTLCTPHSTRCGKGLSECCPACCPPAWLAVCRPPSQHIARN